MNILVVGASGKTGRAVVAQLREDGHQVTAFVRNPDSMAGVGVRISQGDVCDASQVASAVRGHDAVVVTLGISEHPLAVRLRGARHTRIDVRSVGTQNVVTGMQQHGVKRLAVLTSYGVGSSRALLPLKWRMIFSLFLKPQIADTEVQEQIVRNSDVDWTLVQPVALTDDMTKTEFLVSPDGATRSMAVPRKHVARVLSRAASGDFSRKCVAVSA